MIGRPWRALWRRDDGPPSVLVDHWYSHAVGHVIEALRRCQGYHACDPSLRLSLVLNGASPVELAACVPFVERAYAVPYTSFGAPEGNPRKALAGVPRTWDFVLHHPAATDPREQRFEGLQRYYAAAQRHFRARRRAGVVGTSPPAYEPHQTLRLVLPEAARDRARELLAGRRAIAVMPAGSSSLRALYPSVTSWSLVLGALEERFPGVVFALVGRLRAEGGRTSSGITRPEVDRLLASHGSLDVFDAPIVEQLAVVEAADLFLSPHTGFGFAAVAVGTPWLAISGGDWHESFFNGVPFHSVLPKGRGHPVFVQSRPLPMLAADDDGEGPRTATMSARRIREDLDELVEAAGALIDGRLSYEEALAAYFPRLLDAYGGDRARIHTFEDLHRRFI